MSGSPGSRLAISNIAWTPPDDDAIAAVLVRNGVTGVELAPTKWRSDPYLAPAPEVLELRETWRDRGLEVVSLQSLLFGRPELQLFGDTSARGALFDELRRALDFAGTLGAHVVVFGSPKNRVRGALPLADANEIAREFLRAIGDHAQARDVAFCVEANPPQYGCDFVTTTAEAVDLCRLVDHSGIRVNCDLGGMTMSGDDARTAVVNARELIAHFHASEPNLSELGAGADHARAAQGLESIGYSRWVSIEMRASNDGNDIAATERAVQLARRAYGSES